MRDLYIVEKTVRIGIYIYDYVLVEKIKNSFIRTLNLINSIAEFNKYIYTYFAELADYMTDELNTVVYFMPDIWGGPYDLKDIIEINETEFRKSASDEDDPSVYFSIVLKIKYLDDSRKRTIKSGWIKNTYYIEEMDENVEKVSTLGQLEWMLWSNYNTLEDAIKDIYDEGIL